MLKLKHNRVLHKVFICQAEYYRERMGQAQQAGDYYGAKKIWYWIGSF